jgi:DNA-binding transcriptional MocR family regulator
VAKGDAKIAKVEAKTDAKVAKTEAKGGPGADAKIAKIEAKTANAEPTAGTSETGDVATTPTPTPSTIDFTSGPVGEKLTRNTKLRSKLETRLQAAGYEGTVYQAAYGFKNLGQFVAATNVSQHTGIPFDQLRIQMTGYSVDATGTVLRANVGPDGTVTLVAPADATSPAPTLSLGQSIQTLNPTVDATAEAQSATVQADAEIGASTVSN